MVLIDAAKSSHALWAIEEYVIMVFVSSWFRPPRVPTNKARAEIAIILFILKQESRSRGATFCHVNKIKHWGQCKLVIMLGNQKCRGGTPAFISKEIRINNSIDSILIDMEDDMRRFTLIISKVEARAWTKKYLIAASTRGFLTLISMRGAILIKFISRPSQLVNQELADTAIKVPRIKVEIKISW